MKINHCIECAAPLEKVDDTRYICPNGHTYYNNPHGAVSVILLRPSDGRICYAKRARDPHKGKYDLPGGFLEYGEDVYAASVREIGEELGITIDPENLRLIDCSCHEYIENVTSCDFVLMCEKWQGEPKAADDVAAFEWKPIEFINSEEFAWDYSRLAKRLKKYTAEGSRNE